MVQKSVINAIKSLHDREVGQMTDGIGEDLAATSAVKALTDDYRQARDKTEGIVASVSRTALRSTLGLAAIATIPLVIWLILGWVLGEHESTRAGDIERIPWADLFACPSQAPLTQAPILERASWTEPADRDLLQLLCATFRGKP